MNKPEQKQYTDFEKAMALTFAMEEMESAIIGARELGYDSDWIEQMEEYMEIVLSMKGELNV